MILAAGLGKRMRPLTETTPKPLLCAAGKPLISYQLARLAEVGVDEVVINTHWLAEQLPQQLGSGNNWGLNIHYSHEPTLLETAGGIIQALPLLQGDEAWFLLLNSDVYCEYDLSTLIAARSRLGRDCLAVLGMVANPEYHSDGDFAYHEGSALLHPLAQHSSAMPSMTYAGIGLFHEDFFRAYDPGYRPLAPLLHEHIAREQVQGCVISDYWLDVGTPERLAELDKHLSA